MSLTIVTDEKRSERQRGNEDGCNVGWNDVLYVYTYIYMCM